MYKDFDESDVAFLEEPNFVNVHKQAIKYSDAVIYGCDTIKPEIQDFVKESKLPTLEFQADENYIDRYSDFYDTILES